MAAPPRLRTPLRERSALDIKAILTPPCIFHQQYSIQNIQGGVRMTLAFTARSYRGDRPREAGVHWARAVPPFLAVCWKIQCELLWPQPPHTAYLISMRRGHNRSHCIFLSSCAAILDCHCPQGFLRKAERGEAQYQNLLKSTGVAQNL